MPPQHIDRETFLANLRQSGLVSDDQLAEVAARLPETRRGRVLARSLVELGLLTRFQAERILVGRTGGFLLGPYRILDQLGQGGMGRVFKARHRTLGRTVALKVLSPDLVKSGRARQLFLREALAAASLTHPNIVTAYDADHVGDRYFLVMEFVDGPNLDQLVQEEGPLPPGVACDYALQVAGGLQAAFEAGMVHRDIKPANLLLRRDAGVVKISDFGLARLHEQARNTRGVPPTILVKENTVVGTPDYLSPEQAHSIHKADIRSDLYSLGCTLYYLLTGEVPFPGGSSVEKLIRHCTEEPSPVEELRPEVPRPVADVVRRLMAKDPGKRYQTPAELAAALAPLAERRTSRPRTPVPDELPPDTDPNLDAGDDSSALTGTVPLDPVSTPLPPDEVPAEVQEVVAVIRRRRWKRLAWLTACVAGAVLAGVGAAALLIR